VDNTCKAILDDVASAATDPDSKLVIVGNAGRVKNARTWQANEPSIQGISVWWRSQTSHRCSRIEVRTDFCGTKTAEYWVVPAVATFLVQGPNGR
jgi:hypothetical protein